MFLPYELLLDFDYLFLSVRRSKFRYDSIELWPGPFDIQLRFYSRRNQFSNYILVECSLGSNLLMQNLLIDWRFFVRINFLAKMYWKINNNFQSKFVQKTFEICKEIVQSRSSRKQYFHSFPQLSVPMFSIH